MEVPATKKERVVRRVLVIRKLDPFGPIDYAHPIFEAIQPFMHMLSRGPDKDLVWVDLSEKCKALYNSNPFLPSSNIKRLQEQWADWKSFGESIGLAKSSEDPEILGIWASKSPKIATKITGQTPLLRLNNQYKACRQRFGNPLTARNLEASTHQADYALQEDIDWLEMRKVAENEARNFAQKYICWQNGNSVSGTEFENELKNKGLLRLANKKAVEEFKKLVAAAQTKKERGNLSRFMPEEIWSWDEVSDVETFLENHEWKWHFHTHAVIDEKGSWIELDYENYKKWACEFFARFIVPSTGRLLSVVQYEPTSDLWEYLTKDTFRDPLINT